MSSLNNILNATTKNLLEGKELILDIDKKTFTNKDVPPYYSSIGGHFRHLLDVFNCILNGLESKKVDLTARERNLDVENNPDVTIAYIDAAIERMNSIKNIDANTMVEVEDDIGLGNIKVEYTLGAALCQANSHAIHHFASIGNILDSLNVPLNQKRFGYNPTTPKEQQAGLRQE